MTKLWSENENVGYWIFNRVFKSRKLNMSHSNKILCIFIIPKHCLQVCGEIKVICLNIAMCARECTEGIFNPNLLELWSLLVLSVLRPFQIFPKDDFVISSEMLTVDGSSLDERKHIFMHFQFQAIAVISSILKEIVLQEQRRPSKHFYRN